VIENDSYVKQSEFCQSLVCCSAVHDAKKQAWNKSYKTLCQSLQREDEMIFDQ
jgi:hypothetical protein